MIDFLKAYVNDHALARRLTDSVCTRVETDLCTGEITRYFGKCNQFGISVHPSGRTQIKGSIHKYYTEGYNDSDFSIIQLRQAIRNLEHWLGVGAEKIILENLEFGVNISLPYSPELLLDNIVSLTTGDSFAHQVGRGLYCKLTEYRHKIYMKGQRLLRYELHVDKMRKIYPVKTLQDLCLMSNWEMLQSQLLKHFRHIVFDDEYDEERMVGWAKKFFKSHSQEYTNARFWQSLPAVNRHRHLYRLGLVQKQGKYRFGENIARMINDKIEELKSCKEITIQMLGENVASLQAC